MKTVSGQLRRVTDPAAFLQSWASTGGKPTKGHAPYGGARVHLVSDFPLGQFSHSLIPSFVLKTDTDAQGRFSFTVPPPLADARCAVVAFQVTTTPSPLPGMPPLPVIEPIYRSLPFKVASVPTLAVQAARTLYVYQATTPDSEGVTQATVTKLVGELRKKMKLDKLSATIGKGRVAVKAEDRGATIKFNAYVRGATVPDLERVIEIKAGEIDWDLPGPDFLSTICVNEAQIEGQIRSGLADLSKNLSRTLLKALEKQVPLPGIGNLATVSVWRTRFVQTGTTKVTIGPTTISIPVHAAVPDGALGLPRSLY